MIVYNQWPYRIALKDQPTYIAAYSWCLKNLVKGLWVPDYTKPNVLKFVQETDAVEVSMRFG